MVSKCALVLRIQLLYTLEYFYWCSLADKKQKALNLKKCKQSTQYFRVNIPFCAWCFAAAVWLDLLMYWCVHLYTIMVYEIN